ncbi:hypothetical protein T440DRAFT_470426 [Plenodomus tracheiphilus IPT5]|uniref:TMEM205-like domain-containing protein n=1 Tax=Plenodomus tracheiphilus IPT5 TaxID=1408161 RepID=A0A6A7AZ24_9PLEO|nr:hypothetical protein T440DRAFT_470426 [Plenodomus tracheiphilus IPT5]
MTFITTVLDGLSTLANLAPYHVISYGTLLGTTLYQTFVMTKVCYQALPMSAFTTLQKRIFPIYFRMQTALLVLTAVTLPPYGPLSFFEKKKDWIPLGFASGLAVLNLFVYGPRTQTTMIERIHQETRDGRKSNDPEISEEMRAKNRAFSRAHAMSIHLNLMAVIATLWYGVRLGSRFNLAEQSP